MKKNLWSNITKAVLAALCIIVLVVSLATAQDVKELAKQANNEIRQSQRMMFNGKLEESLQHLQQAAELLEQIKAADPDFSQLKSLQSKYDKQKKDLDKRLPKEEQPVEAAPTEKPEPTVKEEPPAEPTPEEQPQPATAPEGQDPAALAKEADKAIKNSQRAMFGGKLDDAKAELDKAAQLIEQIKAADPNFSQLKSLDSKYTKQFNDLRKRLPETPEEKVIRLLEGPSQNLAEVAQLLADDNPSQDVVNQAESLLTFATNRINAVLQEVGDQVPPDQPDVQAIQQQIAELQQQLEARKAGLAAKAEQVAAQQAEKEAFANEWLQKLNVYREGDKELIGSGTANVDELLHRKAMYEEAKALFEEYRKVDFPQGKTVELELAEEDLVYNFEGFEKGYQETIDGFAEKASQQLAHAEEWLTEQEAKIAADPTMHPPYLHQMVIQGITNEIFALDAATAGADSRVSGFKARLAGIEERAQALRQRGVELTVMLPDKFQGAEADVIKTKAAEFLNKEYADAEGLRTTIIDADWNEEQAWEYTDTTKTAIRYRITRSVTVQIAAKRGNDVFLYSIHVAKNQRSDGSWGELYGHVMFVDPMLEENVNK